MSNRFVRKSTGDEFNKFIGIVTAWIVFCIVTGLAVVGVVVWAVIQLVQHFTG